MHRTPLYRLTHAHRYSRVGVVWRPRIATHHINVNWFLIVRYWQNYVNWWFIEPAYKFWYHRCFLPLLHLVHICDNGIIDGDGNWTVTMIYALNGSKCISIESRTQENMQKTKDHKHLSMGCGKRSIIVNPWSWRPSWKPFWILKNTQGWALFIRQIYVHVMWSHRTKWEKPISGMSGYAHLAAWLIASTHTPPSAAYMCQWNVSIGSDNGLSPIQRLFGATPISRPMLGYFQLEFWEE